MRKLVAFLRPRLVTFKLASPPDTEYVFATRTGTPRD